MKLLCVFIFVAGIRHGAGEKILAFVSMPSRSHYQLFERLCLELTDKGHEVTFIAPFKQSKPVPRLKEIYLENLYQDFIGSSGINSSSTSNMFKFGKWINWAQLFFVLYMSPRYTDILLSRPKMQNLLKKEERFDLVIGETLFDESLVAGFSYHFKAPIVAIAASVPHSWAYHMVGNPAPVSYIPDTYIGYDNKMSYWERVENTFYGLVSDFLYHAYYIGKHDEILKKHFGDRTPYVGDIIKNTSLVLVNHHFSLAFPRPYLPNMVEIGGFHIQPLKPLPADLEKYLNESKEGVILFSLGSYIKSSELPKEQKEAILKAFSRLKQNVLWKSDDETLTNLPKNVKIIKWVPQSDVLAHPNLKLFISHGGLLSTMEAIARGVPIIGIPIIGDQPFNMKCNEAAGYGRTMDLWSITENILYDAILDVLNNPKYKENVKRGSVLLKDRPLPAIDMAIYWIEYVMRHKGAPHLRSSAQDLTWYQLYLLDVSAFIFLISCLSIFFSFHIGKFIAKKLFFRKSTKVSKVKKGN